MGDIYHTTISWQYVYGLYGRHLSYYNILAMWASIYKHWGPVTHMYSWHKAIVWNNGALLSTGPIETSFFKIWIKLQIIPFKIYIWKSLQSDGHFCSTQYVNKHIVFPSTVPPYWTPHGDRLHVVSKSCSTARQCNRERDNMTPFCKRDWYSDWKCVECCSGDMCNYYVTVCVDYVINRGD